MPLADKRRRLSALSTAPPPVASTMPSMAASSAIACSARAKPVLALDLENERDLYAAALLDLVVGIEEAQLEAPGEQPTDGCLAGPHQADQEDVPRLHPGIVGTNAGACGSVERRVCRLSG